MATNQGDRGVTGSPALYLLLGGLVVAVGVLAYLYYQESQDSADITIELPTVETE